MIDHNQSKKKLNGAVMMRTQQIDGGVLSNRLKAKEILKHCTAVKNSRNRQDSTGKNVLTFISTNSS